ncbi:MAG: hypothetical protein ABMA01_21670 [Chthoniobacteraceae bacterium]
MKILTQLLLTAAMMCLCSSCLFKEPVFADGFAKTDPGLPGVWVSEEEKGDPRKLEFAVVAPIDDTRLVLHHPSGEKGGLYYEARQLGVRGRTVLQLRVLATFSDGIPKPDAERYTLLWLEKADDGKKLRIRAMGGDGVKDKSPVDVRKFLEDPAADWNDAFGEVVIFRRLEDR